MDTSQSGATNGGLPLEDALDERLVTVESGNYKRNLRYMIGEEFVPFARERGIERIEEIDVYTCQAWARELHRRRNDETVSLSASSAHTYFAAARAWLGWCVKQGYIGANPAERDSAESELPTDAGDVDRQFWSPSVRRRFVSYLTREVDRALDGEIDRDPLVLMRDRAIVALLAYSGLRGAEVFNDYDDDGRNGLQWADVDLDRKRPTVRVLGKTRRVENAVVLSAAVDPLRRYYDQLRPASEEWPVFPVLDTGTITRKLGSDLREAGYKGDRHPLDVAREASLTPPALSIQAARKAVKRHSSAAGLPDDRDDEYLTLHGARRGLGDELYGTSAELSQEILRHKSVETTHRSYREERMAQRAADAEDALEE